MASPYCGAQNRLVEALPLATKRRFLRECELVDLVRFEILYAANRAPAQVHFPVSGFVSLTASMDGHTGLEVGMVGREGMLGDFVSLGVTDSPLNAVVQGSGTAWRMSVSQFRREMAQDLALRSTVNRYLYVRIAQLASRAACVKFHLIGSRLARWLLMSHDRAGANSFFVTHEVLACVLGVRRVSVTQAANALQQAGLISYKRGEITVLRRRDLERISCSCYSADIARYDAQFG